MKPATCAIALGLACLCISVSPAASQAAPFCGPGQQPHFSGGFEALYNELKIAKMGSPIECEHPDNASGDALQQTDRGLAFYRLSTNTPTFTNGIEHWALTEKGLVYWTADSVDPPEDASAPPKSPEQVASERASYVRLLMDTALAWLQNETTIEGWAREMRLRTIPPGGVAGLASLLGPAVKLTTGPIRAATPPEDLQVIHGLYLVAADEFEAGMDAAATGLAEDNLAVLDVALSHFLRSRQFVAQAQALLG